MSVDGQTYTWDANGNLLSDGATTYGYTNNKLSSITNGNQSITFKYNGLGDLLQKTVNGTTTSYTLDINNSLSQVLDDGTNTYLYGNGRISQVAKTQTGYYLPDSLGSVRQMVDVSGTLQLARSYDPYGEVLSESGEGESIFGFDGEEQDEIGLVNLRARTYTPWDGRFLTSDTWEGDPNKPMSYNKWLYTDANPVNSTDPSGLTPYNRQAAADYAKQWATQINPVYSDMGDADCTNFVSQALKAGGFPEDKEWFFVAKASSPIYSKRCDPSLGPFASNCGQAWALTDNLYLYLTKTKGFSETKLIGTLPAPPDSIKKDKVLAQGPEWIDAGNLARTGDVVFYRQVDADYFGENPSGLFNHAAFIVGLGQTTLKGSDYYEWPSSRKTLPHIVDHSSTYSPYGKRAINDTYSPVNEIDIIHIPDNIPDNELTTYLQECP